MKAWRYDLASLVILALAPTAGCSPPPDDGGGAVVEMTSKALNMSGADWPHGFIPACYATANGTASEKAALQVNTRVLWPAVAEVEFYGWGRCPGARGGLLGVDIVQQTSSSTVGYSGGNNTLTIRPSATADVTTVGHELGHALGFSHEMSRDDFPDDTDPHSFCQEKPDLAGDHLGTPANDRLSIMAWGYCTQSNLVLEATDIMGVQKAYGPRRVSNNATTTHVASAIYRTHAESDRRISIYVASSSGTRANNWGGASWSWQTLGQTKTGGTVTETPSATTFLETSGTRFQQVFWRNTDNTLGGHFWSGSPPWTTGSLPGSPASGPSATVFMADTGQTNVHVFYRSTSGNVATTFFIGGDWTVADLGKPSGVTLAGRPAAVTIPGLDAQLFHVFTRATDNHIYDVFWNGNQWLWSRVSTAATALSEPDAIVFADDQNTRVFHAVYATSTGLTSTYSVIGSWSDAVISSQPMVNERPSIASGVDGDTVRRFWIFSRGTDGNMYVVHWSGAAPWQTINLGRPSNVTLTAAPEAGTYRTTTGDRRVFAFVRGGSHLYQIYWSGSSWNWQDQGAI